jgi:hypothetical protein
LVEQSIRNRQVIGSSPIVGSISFCRCAPTRFRVFSSFNEFCSCGTTAQLLSAIRRDHGNAGDLIHFSLPSVPPCFKVFWLCFDPRLSAFISGKVFAFSDYADHAVLFHGPLTKPLRFPHFAATLPLQFPACVSHNIL